MYQGAVMETLKLYTPVKGFRVSVLKRLGLRVQE